MQLRSVIQKLEEYAPPKLAQFEYVGLLQGELNQDIKKAGLTLDYSLQAIKQAISNDCDLLITHHGPLGISYPLRGNKLAKVEYASAANLSVYRCHLNLDFCEGGIIHELTNILGIPAGPQRLVYQGHLIEGGVRLAENYPMTFGSLMKRLEPLGINQVRIAGKRRKSFKRIAITSGKGFIEDFFDQTMPEVYIAGEFEQEATKYAEDLGIMLVELSHHASEMRPLEKIAPRFESLLGIPVQTIDIADTIEVIGTNHK